MFGFACNSSIITFILSSNCPLYFVPATTEVKSKFTILLSIRFLGHSPLTIFIAKPSTIAVLPHPGSPKIIGLFFLRLDRICAILKISRSLPITGSNLPSDASLFKSLLKLSKTGVELSEVFCFLLVFMSSSSISSFMVYNFYKDVSKNVHKQIICNIVIINFFFMTICHLFSFGTQLDSNYINNKPQKQKKL